MGHSSSKLGPVQDPSSYKRPWSRGRRAEKLQVPEDINRAWTPSPSRSENSSEYRQVLEVNPTQSQYPSPPDTTMGEADLDGGEGEGSYHEKDNDNVNIIKVQSTISTVHSGSEVNLSELPPSPLEDVENTLPIVITWKQNDDCADVEPERVFVTGTFSGWQKMVPLEKEEKEDGSKLSTWSVLLDLPQGAHKLLFIVNDEMKVSEHLPMATDSFGNFVNYIEVNETIDRSAIDQNYSEKVYEQYNFDEEFPEPIYEYCSDEYPELLTLQPEELAYRDIEPPPILPPQMDDVILNESTNEKIDSSVFPAPNHTVINHLAASSIKHNILSVATTVRYSRKFVTQLLYSPID